MVGLELAGRLHLVRTEAFEPRPAGGFRAQALGDRKVIAVPVLKYLRELEWNRLGIIDLSGIVEVSPEVLMSGIRLAMSLSREKKRPGRFPLLAITWMVGSSDEVAAYHGFVSVWELGDYVNPQQRHPTMFIGPDVEQILGTSTLPESLGGERLHNLRLRRFMTFHSLSCESDQPPLSARRLSQLMKRYGELGLALPRTYRRGQQLSSEAGRTLPRNSRSLVWESVPRAAFEQRDQIRAMASA